MVYNPADSQTLFSHTTRILTLTPEDSSPAQGWFAVREAGPAHWKSFCSIDADRCRLRQYYMLSAISIGGEEMPDSPGETFNITPELCEIIDRAAAILGKSRTDFVLDAVRGAAEDALLDRSLFMVDSKAYAAFVEQLDAPARPNERLRRTLLTRAPWET